MDIPFSPIDEYGNLDSEGVTMSGAVIFSAATYGAMGQDKEPQEKSPHGTLPHEESAARKVGGAAIGLGLVMLAGFITGLLMTLISR